MNTENRYAARVMLVLFILGAPIYVVSGKKSVLSNLNHSQRGELSRAEIKQRLEQVAEEEIRRGNAELTADARGHLNDMLAGAAARVFALADVSQSQRERLERAEQSTQRLVRAAIGIARNFGSINRNNQKLIVTEDHFVRAWRICPLYPFC